MGRWAVVEADDERSAGRASRCDCCLAWSKQPAFAIVAPAGGRTRRVCTRCASHVSLKADGGLWLPATCPDAPRARLRVSHQIGGEGG